MSLVTKKYLDEVTYEIVGAAIEVHKVMGRGLLESIYHQCLKEELRHRKINFLTELQVPVIIKKSSSTWTLGVTCLLKMRSSWN